MPHFNPIFSIKYGARLIRVIRMKITMSIICFFWLIGRVDAQELDRYDCNYAKPIALPLNGEKTLMLNQTVFYTYRDQFTYWYKMTTQKTQSVWFSVSTINDSDAYVIYVYEYSGTDFCNKLYHQNIKPIMPSFEATKTLQHPSISGQVLHVKKDQTYYISVLNTSINNCGHYFNLNDGTEDTLSITALHLPCKRATIALPVAEKEPDVVSTVKDTLPGDRLIVSNTEIKQIESFNTGLDTARSPLQMQQAKLVAQKDTAQLFPKTSEAKAGQVLLTCLVKDRQNGSPVNAKLWITDLETRVHKVMSNPKTGEWVGEVEIPKAYKIQCTAIGYKNLEQVLDVNHLNTIELLMEPLQVGDNFIMKSIYFYPNTYALKQESAEELEKLLVYLKDNPTVHIEIQGHTNGDHKIFKNKAHANLGEEWNFQGSAKKLSLKRSETIKQYLVNHGISAERLLPEGYGGSKPIVKDPETMEEGQKNMRVEVVILKK